jgi:hypothetical protein
MSFVVSRFTVSGGKKNYLQDMHGPGSPYQSRDEAATHLKQVLLSFKQGRFGFRFEVREIGASVEEPATEVTSDDDSIEQALRDREEAGIRADD